MVWIRETKKSWAQSLALQTIKHGPIPRHVAFIMDGNRRYAKRNNLNREKGHLMGFEKLAEVSTYNQNLEFHKYKYFQPGLVLNSYGLPEF